MSRTSVANSETLALVRRFGAALAESRAILDEQDRGDMRRGPLAYPEASEVVAERFAALVEWAGRDYANGVADGVHWAAPETYRELHAGA